MYGQLCPPDLLVALSVLEAVYFDQRGVPEVSLSLAQGSCFNQDVGALIALERLARHYLNPGTPAHRVFYTFMGLFPQTSDGAAALIQDSARIARQGGAERLIVKTAVEAIGIPSIEDNITALNWARVAADEEVAKPTPSALVWADQIEESAAALIQATLELDANVGSALIKAFHAGILDIPFGVHPENCGLTSSIIDPDTGALMWVQRGNMAAGNTTPTAHPSDAKTKKADGFHKALEYVRRTYDTANSPQ
jgi:methylaspartate mutase epsilon subunit